MAEIKRRYFLKMLATGCLIGGVTPEVYGMLLRQKQASSNGTQRLDDHIKDYLYKMHHCDYPHADDLFLDPQTFRVLETAVHRLKRLQRLVGHGNFQLLNLDSSLKIARKYPEVDAFTKAELDFLERIFYQDAWLYGFQGQKPLKDLTHRIKKRNVVKIPGTGNYLYKGVPLKTYCKIREEVGQKAILTSGVRGIMKQFILFLNKAYANRGNLSLASRSLAPPGFSFHGVGDFDMGQLGLGSDNFTERFATTGVFRKLQDLGYIRLRYPKDNLLGVRFEPWHIRANPLA